MYKFCSLIRCHKAYLIFQDIFLEGNNPINVKLRLKTSLYMKKHFLVGRYLKCLFSCFNIYTTLRL